MFRDTYKTSYIRGGDSVNNNKYYCPLCHQLIYVEYNPMTDYIDLESIGHDTDCPALDVVKPVMRVI